MRDVWSRTMEYLGLKATADAQPAGPADAEAWASDLVIYEYLVVEDPASSGDLEVALNTAAQGGWRVSHVVPGSDRSRIVLERAAAPDGADDASSADDPIEWPSPFER